MAYINDKGQQIVSASEQGVRRAVLRVRAGTRTTALPFLLSSKGGTPRACLGSGAQASYARPSYSAPRAVGTFGWRERVTITSTDPIRVATCLFVGLAVGGAFAPMTAQSLRGSVRSLDRQNQVAVQHDFTYLSNTAHVKRFIDAGYLVPIPKGRDYRLNGLSFPYARPEVALFVSRLGPQYKRACGERLVVTSLTRPRSRQPRNASPRSVHPTGMALDLRRSSKRACRSWLEGVLLDLERAGVLEASRERRPPHYHIALFPSQYAEYVAAIGRGRGGEYRVRDGDSLWEIAEQLETTVAEIRSANNMSGSRIYPGQVLAVPSRQ